jgi:Icc-related predicted phosphoesterase
MVESSVFVLIYANRRELPRGAFLNKIDILVAGGCREMSDMFLVLADIHGETGRLELILRENPRVKGIFVAGDLTNFGREREAERVLSVFAQIAPDATLFFIAGNCDTPAARRFFEKHPGYLEQRCTTFALSGAADTTIRLIGCGGGLLHMGLTPFEVSDEELELGLSRAHARCAQGEQGSAASSPPQPLIVLTHTPPLDTFADLRYMKHLGSPAFASLLYDYEPLLWICGHIHEGRSVQWEGRTLVINPGPAAHGSYALMLIEQKPQGLSAAAELRAI